MNDWYDFYRRYDREDEPYVTFDRDEFLTFLQAAEAHPGQTMKFVFNSLPKEVSF